MDLLPFPDAALPLRLLHAASLAGAVALGALLGAGPRFPKPPPLCPAA